MTEKTSVTVFAAIMGMLTENMPNKSHRSVPKANSEYMGNDRPDVFFVLIVLSACGKKEMVVLTAAANPKMVILSNVVVINDEWGKTTQNLG